jgi:hypothetical protein
MVLYSQSIRYLCSPTTTAVQAAEAAGTLTLACDGMKTTQPSVPDPKPDAVSMGITIDFTARRVDGFGSDAGLRITIPDVTETVTRQHADYRFLHECEV